MLAFDTDFLRLHRTQFNICVRVHLISSLHTSVYSFLFSFFSRLLLHIFLPSTRHFDFLKMVMWKYFCHVWCVIVPQSQNRKNAYGMTKWMVRREQKEKLHFVYIWIQHLMHFKMHFSHQPEFFGAKIYAHNSSQWVSALVSWYIFRREKSVCVCGVGFSVDFFFASSYLVLLLFDVRLHQWMPAYFEDWCMQNEILCHSSAVVQWKLCI